MINPNLNNNDKSPYKSTDGAQKGGQQTAKKAKTFMVSLKSAAGEQVTIKDLHQRLADTGATLKPFNPNLLENEDPSYTKNHCVIQCNDQKSQFLVENGLKDLGLLMTPLNFENQQSSKQKQKQKQAYKIEGKSEDFSLPAPKRNDSEASYSHYSLDEEQDYFVFEGDQVPVPAPRVGSLRAIYRHDNFSTASDSPNISKRFVNHMPQTYSHFGSSYKNPHLGPPPGHPRGGYRGYGMSKMGPPISRYGLNHNAAMSNHTRNGSHYNELPVNYGEGGSRRYIEGSQGHPGDIDARYPPSYGQQGPPSYDYPNISNYDYENPPPLSNDFSNQNGRNYPRSGFGNRGSNPNIERQEAKKGYNYSSFVEGTGSNRNIGDGREQGEEEAGEGVDNMDEDEQEVLHVDKKILDLKQQTRNEVLSGGNMTPGPKSRDRKAQYHFNRPDSPHLSHSRFSGNLSNSSRERSQRRRKAPVPKHIPSRFFNGNPSLRGDHNYSNSMKNIFRQGYGGPSSYQYGYRGRGRGYGHYGRGNRGYSGYPEYEREGEDYPRNRPGSINPKEQELFEQNEDDYMEDPEEEATQNFDYKTLLVKGFAGQDANIKGLCNIFSNYGNVSMGFMDSKKAYAYLKFTTAAGAENAVKVLDNFEYLGSNWQVGYALEGQIESRQNDVGEEQEFVKLNPKRYRFRKQVPNILNKPSRSLHFSVLHVGKKIIDHQELLQFLSQSYTLKRIKYIRVSFTRTKKKKGQKHNKSKFRR